MKKIIVVIFSILTIVVNCCANSLVSNADEAYEYTEVIENRNDHLKSIYGISYEDIFNIYPSCLDADKDPLAIIRQTGAEAANELTFEDEVFASMMESLSNQSLSLEYSYRNIFQNIT